MRPDPLGALALGGLQRVIECRRGAHRELLVQAELPLTRRLRLAGVHDHEVIDVPVGFLVDLVAVVVLWVEHVELLPREPRILRVGRLQYMLDERIGPHVAAPLSVGVLDRLPIELQRLGRPHEGQYLPGDDVAAFGLVEVVMRQGVLARGTQVRREEQVLKVRAILLASGRLALVSIEADVRELDRNDQHTVRPIDRVPDRCDRVALDLWISQPIELQVLKPVDHLQALWRLRPQPACLPPRSALPRRPSRALSWRHCKRCSPARPWGTTGKECS